MPTRKNMIVKTTHDVTPFTDEYIETMKAQMRQVALLGGSIVEIEVIREESPMSGIDQLLQSVLDGIQKRTGLKDSDERPRD